MGKDQIMMYTKDGKIIPLKDSEQWFYTITNITSEEWELVENAAVTKINTVNFSDALRALKSYKSITREGWNGKGLYIVKQVPSTINEEVIPKMASLPQSGKDLILANKAKTINYQNQMLIIDNNGNANSWVPSSSGLFAEDWVIL